MQRFLVITLLILPIIFCNHALPAEKSKKKKATASNTKEPAETMSFQDIPFGTPYDAVKSKLRNKYPEIFREKDGNLILGDLTTIDKVSNSKDMNDLKVFKIGDIYSEVRLLFDNKNKLSGYDIISLSNGVFKAMKELAEVIAYKFGSPDFITTIDERNLINTVFLGQSPYMIGYAWFMGKHNAYIGVTSYHHEGYSTPLVLPFAEVIKSTEDITVKPCFKKQYKYEYGDVADKASQF
ncbi:MAG: hypothetical protein FD174_3669 [Geobacteraceae bacterium]|nr:MAG: hypothetical protein FD174_3669 [Geobacteraceae bacterium]